jgi:hypothetical protein
LYLDALAAAVVTGLLGTLPGRTFRFRLILVASVVAVSTIIASFVPDVWIRPVFERHEPPEGTSYGEWGTFGLYLVFAVKTLVLAFAICVAYWLRVRLLPSGEQDSRNRKLLVLASIVLPLIIAGSFLVPSALPLL